MTTATFSRREFHQETSEAKRAANDGPVFMTDRGKPAHVLLSSTRNVAGFEHTGVTLRNPWNAPDC